MQFERQEAFTDAQNDALEQAWGLLSEHFDGALLAIDTDGKNIERSGLVMYHGSHLGAIGLAEVAKYNLVHSAMTPPEDEGDI